MRRGSTAVGLLGGGLVAVMAGGGALAADYTAREITQALFDAESGIRIDLSGKSLRELDLSGVNSKAAKMTGADLYGTNLADADLKNTDLTGALLDRAVVTRTNFNGAKLEGITLFRPTIYSRLERDQAEAPTFVGAKLKGARFSGWLDGTDFSKADLTGVVFGNEDAHREGLLASRVRMVGCKFVGANLEGADLHGSSLVFGKFMGANLKNANLSGADLSNSDFSGADVTGMNVTGANLSDANFSDAIGLDTVIGLDKGRVFGVGVN